MYRQELTFDTERATLSDAPFIHPHSLQLPLVPSRADPDNEIALLYGEALRLNAWHGAPLAHVMDWCQRAHDRLTTLTDPASIARWQELLGPLFRKSPFLDRAVRKPHGYAGDFVTIQMMYDGEPSGENAFARGIDAWALSQPCPKAVRNRRALVCSPISDLGARFAGEHLSITSLGAGSAAEVFDCIDAVDASFNLVDIDARAIQYVRDRVEDGGLSDRVTPILGNIVKMLMGRSIALPGNQHAFYSLGVIDYFADDLVVRLLDFAHARLRKGGVVLLGNFRPGHANAAFFTHALDWQLHLRSEAQLQELVARSKFATSKTRIGSESEGVQLFVECVKA